MGHVSVTAPRAIRASAREAGHAARPSPAPPALLLCCAAAAAAAAGCLAEGGPFQGITTDCKTLTSSS